MSIRFIGLKLLRAVFTMWLVVTFVFFVLRLTGDPVSQLLPDDVDQSTIDYYRRQWGLDQPIFVQYWRYFAALFQGEAVERAVAPVGRRDAERDPEGQREAERGETEQRCLRQPREHQLQRILVVAERDA
ncbi:MAG: hypothetical protein AAFZ09_05240, partial [Pseudomonadota bacterium]